MKAQSDKKPNIKGFEISQSGGLADVRFFENVKEISEGEENRYEYETTSLAVDWYEGIEADIEADLVVWKQKANPPEILNGKTTDEKLNEMAEQLFETQANLSIAQTALDFLLIGGI